MHLRSSYLLLSVALVLSSMSPAFAADTAPPQLVDWSIGGGADISNLDGQVKVNFILSDDSEIEPPKLLLKSLTTSQVTSFATVRVIQKSGKFTSYEATAVVQKGQAPRNWEWVLYPLSDSLGNRSTQFGPGDKWVSTVSVFNSEYTEVTFRCEKNVNAWNSAISRLEELEKRYSSFDDFSVFRLKYFRKLVKIDMSLCVTSPTDIDDNRGEILSIDLAEVIDRVTAKSMAAADKAAASVKKITINCARGKVIKKVSAVNPKCPAGFKKR